MMGVSVTFRILAIVDYAILLAAISENVQTQFLTLLFAFLSLIATAWIAKRQTSNDKTTGEAKTAAEKAVELSVKNKATTDEIKVVADKTHDAVNTNHQKDQDDLRELRQEIAALKEKVLNVSVGEATARQEVKSGKEASEKAVAVAAEVAGRSGIGIALPPSSAAADADVHKVEIVKIPEGKKP